jgi:PAS domain S-box-containing protein
MSPAAKSNYSRIVSVLVMLLGLTVMAAWYLKIPLLINAGTTGNITMKFNTALSFFLAGACLWFLASTGNRYNRVGIVISSVLLTIGTVSFLQFILSTNLGIDQLFITDRFTNPDKAPGRMSPATALNISLTGLAFLFLFLNRLHQLVQIFSIIILCIAGLVAISYAFNFSYRANINFFSSMALHSTVAFMLIATGILATPRSQTTQFPFEWKLIGSICSVIVVMFVSFYLFNKSNADFIDSSYEVEHTREVLYETEQLLSLSKDIVMATRGYVITRDEKFLKPLHFARDSVASSLARLSKLISDNPLQQTRVAKIEKAVKNQFAFSDSLVTLTKSGRTAMAQQMIEEGKGMVYSEEVWDTISQVKATETELLNTRKATHERNISEATRVSMIFIILASVMLVVVYLFIQANMRARNLAEKELKESEEWFSTSLSSIGDGVMVTDQHGRIIFMNPMARNLTRWGNEAYGKNLETVFDIVDERTKKTADNPVRKILGEIRPGPIAQQSILIRKDKTEIAIDENAAPIINDDGDITGVVLVFRDVTEKRKIEEQNKYNSVLIQNISDAIISTDEKFVVMSWNKAAEEMYGYTPEEALGKPLGSVIELILSDEDREKALGLLRKTDFYKDEFVFKAKNGEPLVIMASVNVFRNPDGEISGYVAVHRDITERRKSEERIKYLAGLIDQTSDAIVSVDNNFRIVTWNVGAEQMYGYTREEAIGKDFTQISQTETTDAVRESREHMIRITGTWSGDATHRDRNGNLIYLNKSITAIANQDNKPSGYVMVLRNITERRKLEEQLRNFNKELETQVIQKTREIKQVFDRVNEGFMAFDRHWRFTYMNKKAGEIYKLDPASLIGKVVWEVFPSAVGNPFYEAAHRAMKEQEYIRIEDYSDIFDYWYESHLYPDEEGLSVYFRDVTESRKSAELLRTSEETRRLIISSAMDAIVCADMEGKITVWNSQAEKIFGWSESEAKGLDLTQTIIPPRYRARHLEGMKIYASSGHGPMLNRLNELFAVRRNGEEFPIEITVIPIHQNGTSFFCAFIRDITERKKIETAILREKELSEKIIDSLPGIFYFFDKKGKFLRWNKQVEEITGFTAEEISRMHPADFFESNIKQDVFGNIEKVYNKGTSEAEGYLRCKDGSRIPFYFTGSLIEYNGTACIIGTGINIAERKKAEKKLKEERLLLRTLIDNLPDYIYVVDREYKHIINNKANVQLIGAETEEETLGKTAYDYFGEEIAKSYIEDDEKVFKTHQPIINRQEKLVTPNGEQRWLLTTKVPLIDARLQTSMIVGISRDITEHKKVQEEIERSNKRFEMIARTTNDAVWEWDMKENYVWVNEMHQRLYGRNMKDPAPSHEEWKRRLHPDEREKILASLEKALQNPGRNSWIAEYRFLDGNNEYKSIYDRTYIVRDEQGKPLRMLGSMMDITDRKKAEETLRLNEEKYRLLFSNSPLPMWVFELETLRFLDVNEAAIRHYGYSRDEFLQMTIRDIRPAADIENMIKTSSEINPNVRTAGTWRHFKKDGTIIEVEINSHDILYNNKKARLVLANDITDKLTAQRKIIETSEQLRQLSARLQDIREEERRHMAHEIHDELGQRLTVLKMDVSWLSRKMKIDDEAAREKIKGTLQLLDGTIKIVRKIATDLRPGILDDLGLIPALEWQSKEFEERSGIKVHFQSNISEIALPTMVSTGLFRIFQESLTNIGRHAEARSIVAHLKKDDKNLVLSVSDDGKGFDTSTLGSRKTLGIMGMKERALTFMGEFAIVSQNGAGTTITVKIPLDKIG